ncbi:PorT family protein [Fibrisoma montanum]|nr:PorT family protein [Fibrisoma montanum]
MKIKHTLLALGLSSVGLVYGQTTSTMSSTTSTSTYSSGAANTGVTTTDTARVGTTDTQMTSPMNTNSSTGSMSTPTTNSNYNNATTTTTTTTTSTDMGSMNTSSNRDANGRRADGKQGRFGIYAGVNASQFIGEPIAGDETTGRVGYQLGLYGRTGGTVFGQIGAEFRASSTELFRRGGGQTVGDLRDRIDQYFIAVPIFIGVRAGGPLGFRAQIGPELATLFAIGDNNFNFGNDDVNRLILNGVADIGINLGPLTLDAFYNRGFVNVFDQGADTKRQIVGLNLGLRF